MPDEEKKRYTEAGVDNYIHKPLDIDEIKFQVERYLKHRQVPREHLGTVLSEVSIDEEADSFPLCDIALEEQSNTPIEGQDSENTDIEHSPVSPMTDEEEVTEAKRSKEEKREEKNFAEEVAVEQDSKEEVLIVEQTVPQYEIKYIDIPLNSKSRNRNT
jgi:DNA-binding response OmpR family regulator